MRMVLFLRSLLQGSPCKVLLNFLCSVVIFLPSFLWYWKKKQLGVLDVGGRESKKKILSSFPARFQDVSEFCFSPLNNPSKKSNSGGKKTVRISNVSHTRFWKKKSLKTKEFPQRPPDGVKKFELWIYTQSYAFELLISQCILCLFHFWLKHEYTTFHRQKSTNLYMLGVVVGRKTLTKKAVVGHTIN